MNKELENTLEIGAVLDKKWVILEFIIFIFDQGSVSVQGSKDEIPLEYLAMEFIPGGSLRSTMSDEGFYPEGGMIRAGLTKKEKSGYHHNHL